MRRLVAVFLLAAAIGLHAQEVKVEIRQMTPTTANNQRFPVIAENSRGERLYTYRGSDRYSHFYFYKNGTWTGGGRVPGSPQYDDYWFSDIVADSTGTFHYVAENADRALYYGYFQNGAWASMRKLDVRHEATLALGVRSDDTIVLVSALKTVGTGGLTKDVIIGTKPKNSTNFTGFKNITNDVESSTMVDVAIDAHDNSWVAYKGAFLKGKEETLQAVLLEEDKTNKELYFKNVSGHEFPAWSWYPRVAVNSDGKVMVTWMMSQQQLYFSRLYDPATKKWTEPKTIMNGPNRPWPTMYNKLLARGPDFYWIGLTTGRVAELHKYSPDDDSWSKLADVSRGGVNWVSACNAANSILVSWDSASEPMACFLTEVTADFAPIIRIQSVANLAVEKKVERGFFHGYTLNALTWEANPLNAEQNITVAAQRLYRKARTADASAWTMMIELGASVYSYEDKNIAADSDFVYAVTCVDDKGAESPIIDPSATGTGAASDSETKSRPARIEK
jgi:hypothetical protein